MPQGKSNKNQQKFLKQIEMDVWEDGDQYGLTILKKTNFIFIQSLSCLEFMT